MARPEGLDPRPADPKSAADRLTFFGGRWDEPELIALFAEAISGPVESKYMGLDEVLPRLVTPAAQLAPLSPRLLAWLLERHLERTMNDLNIGRIEARLERRGLIPTRPAHPPAVAFVDVSGYTRLTAERGDELGALTAVRLAELADGVVWRVGGRVMKLLGDGVLLVFESPCIGMVAEVELMGAMLEAGLPPAHAGVHAGPIVERDGDVDGTTVNIASRIAVHARPGVLLVSQPVVHACPTSRPGSSPWATSPSRASMSRSRCAGGSALGPLAAGGHGGTSGRDGSRVRPASLTRRSISSAIHSRRRSRCSA